MSGTRRSILRLAAIPLLINAGWSQSFAATGKKDDNVDVAALARSIDLDPKLSRCTVTKERSGKGLENLLTVLKKGEPPAIARAVHRWKQQRIAGETRKTPKFIFGAKSGSDKDAKIAIMSDEYDSVTWGPTFDDEGGRTLYKKMGKAVEDKSDAPLEGKLDPMLTGLREALEITARDDLIEWGEKFTVQDLAAVSQQVIATQEPQEAEIAEGVKLEVGMQTYTTRQLYAYMHPVYDPDKNALSCDKLEDSLPVSTEYQLYVSLTGIKEGEEAELADASDIEVVPGEEVAQGDADLSDELPASDATLEDEVALNEGGDPAEATEEQDVALIDETTEPGEEAVVEAEGEPEEVVEVEEVDSGYKSKSRPKKKYYPDEEYYEEPIHTVDDEPVEIVENCEDYVDDWYDYPGYYDDYDYVDVYYEPLPPPIFIRPPVIVTPVIALFGGAVVFAAVTRPRWQRPWWQRPVPLARNNTTININFIKPNRPKTFKPGWGLKQNRGFVKLKPKKGFAGRKNRLIPAKAVAGKRNPPAAGRAGLFKPKNKNAANKLKGQAAKNALAKRRAAAKKAALQKKKAALKNNPALAKKKAAAARKAAARKKAAAAKAGGQKKATAAKRAAARKQAAQKAALAKKKAAAQKAKGNKKALAAKRAAAKKQAAQKAALAKKKAAAKKAKGNKKALAAKKAAAKKQAAQKAALAKKKAAASKKAAANKKAAAARQAAARKQAAQKAAAAKQRAASKKAAARQKALANKKAKQRAQQQAKQRAQQQAKQRAQQQARQRAQQKAKQRAQQQAAKRAQQQARAKQKKGPRPCPPGKRRVPGKGCI